MKIPKSALNYFSEYAYDACEGECMDNHGDIDSLAMTTTSERYFGVDLELSDNGRPELGILFEDQPYPISPHQYPAGLKVDELVERVFDAAYDQYLRYPTEGTKMIMKSVMKQMI